MKFGPIIIGKDGGEDSNVDGVMFEIKSLFSIGILRFKNGSREAFHSHAFNCVSWLLSGMLLELPFSGLRGHQSVVHFPGAFIKTRREDIHKVSSWGTSYVLTFRGPWKRTWVDVEEVRENGPLAHYWHVKTLTHGRDAIEHEFFEDRLMAARYAWMRAGEP